MKTSFILLLFLLTLSSCDYSQLKKENVQLKHQVDSLSAELDKSIEVSNKYRDLAFKAEITAFGTAMKFRTIY